MKTTDERLAVLEHRMNSMAPKVDAMHDMMLEARGASKARNQLWEVLKGSRSVAAVLAAVTVFCVAKWDHLVQLFR
jgi:anti-sigma-K factor RskA